MVRMKMDFLCVGFAKCGTTTLDAILRKYQQIKLPVIKEPRFFHWYKEYEEPLEKLQRDYFTDIRDEHCVGIIDPAMTKVPFSEVDRCFGSQTKIIIMMRNPVNALYSDFRMGLRAGYYWGYFRPFQKTTVNQKFAQFLSHCENKQHDYKKFDLYCYEQYLEGLYALRDRENVKIIIFEEFIKDPNSFKEDIENFLGIEPENVDFNVWVNEGKKICKNYFCARINNYLLQKKNNPDPEIKRKGTIWLNKARKYTLVENPEKLSDEMRKKCEDMYRSSKDRVAELTGKNLDELWFQ